MGRVAWGGCVEQEIMPVGQHDAKHVKTTNIEEVLVLVLVESRELTVKYPVNESMLILRKHDRTQLLIKYINYQAQALERLSPDTS